VNTEIASDETGLTLRPTSRGKIIGKSDPLQHLFGSVDRVARANCTVLVTGESGTGKETVVAALHDASPRKDAPLVTLNCGAIPEALLESELFGHAKGAFTGAHAARQGRVAAAEGGTLFLDEIGELPLGLQVKLLRLLQQKEYSMVGDSRTMRCNVRIVAATNRDLEAEVRAGRFREDLYYRLNVVHLHIPPLRERTEDVRALLSHFFRQLRMDLGREDLAGFSAEAMTLLESYSWPGNVRELENLVERCVLLSAGPEVDVRDLPEQIRTGADRKSNGGQERVLLPALGIDLRNAVEELESSLIRQALARTGGNKNRAAQLLGLNRTTLVEMVKRKNIAC
jgi:sigma-54 specific flagellar transcriptional regulator A